MPAVSADFALSSRWILPMTAPGVLLENHTLLVQDGRILDLLPTAAAQQRYAARVTVDRSAHLVLPGLVNAYALVTPATPPERRRDVARLRIAQMLKAGTTCFCGVGFFPEELARTAAEQGMRALVGIPIAAAASPWAASASEYLTRALSFRDEYREHPTIATVFAPDSPCAIADATFRRIATLADELDAGILMALHESTAAVEESLAHHGVRPIERMHALGLLTPALNAVHMVRASQSEIELAQRAGIAVTLCPEADFLSGNGPPPVASWAATGLRLGVGSAAAEPAGAMDLWTELRLLALLSHAPDTGKAALSCWDTLAAATRGGAAALGLDAQVGTLEKGKWADLCCIDLRGPAMRGQDPVTHLVQAGGRDTVSDVWVSGRQLLDAGAFTRLDWPTLSARLSSWREPAIPEVQP